MWLVQTSNDQHIIDDVTIQLYIVLNTRSCKRSEALFKSLLFWLAGEVSWLAVEGLSPCQK